MSTKMWSKWSISVIGWPASCLMVPRNDLSQRPAFWHSNLLWAKPWSIRPNNSQQLSMPIVETMIGYWLSLCVVIRNIVKLSLVKLDYEIAVGHCWLLSAINSYWLWTISQRHLLTIKSWIVLVAISSNPIRPTHPSLSWIAGCFPVSNIDGLIFRISHSAVDLCQQRQY